MKLCEAYKEVVTEGHKYEFGCIMVLLPINKNNWQNVLNIIDPDDLHGVDGDYGRELEPHVTIIFGLHDNIPDEEVERIMDQVKIGEISLVNISSFESSGHDVLKFDVNCPDLHNIHTVLANLPNSDSFTTYHPHATIAYLKQGTAKKYNTQLDKPLTIQPKQIKYSKPDGTVKIYNI